MTGSTVRSVMALHHPSNGTELLNEDFMPNLVNPTAIVSTLTFTMGIIMVIQSVQSVATLTSLAAVCRVSVGVPGRLPVRTVHWRVHNGGRHARAPLAT